MFGVDVTVTCLLQNYRRPFNVTLVVIAGDRARLCLWPSRADTTGRPPPRWGGGGPWPVNACPGCHVCSVTCRCARTSRAIPENHADFCARLVSLTRDAYLRTAASCLRTAPAAHAW